MNGKSVLGAVAALAFATTAFAAGPHEAPVLDVVNGKLKAVLTDPVLVSAIKAQNAKTVSYSQADIDALDQKWRAEVDAGGGELIDETLQSAASKYLQKVRDDEQGLLTEVFVMDARGLNVGQSDPTSDYWQGDEAKWQKTFGTGGEAVFVDEIEQDESTQMLQSQASFTILDPETGEAIGAATVGVNLDMLDL
ncbi:hypothetical protein [Jiella marina]|uniref:hypothetical protein n=1 Tax=Jiella sp. LLJ827 TaxID=2917712 RepID=UPI002100AD9F|nr:hypothetical protein [Jiella sp. LLJ827]MCQ0989408.1 hypothetical protein [Jiella sp. LLJ827]